MPLRGEGAGQLQADDHPHLAFVGGLLAQLIVLRLRCGADRGRARGLRACGMRHGDRQCGDGQADHPERAGPPGAQRRQNC